MTTALILAGHGSQISPNTAGVVWGYVDKLRSWGVADEVTACFWKEPPDFRGVLDSVQAENIVIVPVFTAQGFFTQKVIPAEMGLEEIRRHGIFYARTLGEHPYLATIVRERIDSAIKSAKLAAQQVTVALIGHGTRRMSASQDATREQAEKLRALGNYGQVLDVYLDAEPEIPSVYDSAEFENIIALPFFLAEGSHVSLDVPEALGIHFGENPSQVQSHRVYYTPPVGTYESICELILELARESALPFEKSTAQAWHGFPKTGEMELLAALSEQKELRFGQIILKFDAVYPIDSRHEHLIDSPDSLRQHVRENPFRPLAYADDLPKDWTVTIKSVEQMAAVVETVYPQALADWAAYQNGTLGIESLESLIGRQVGMFSELILMPQAIAETLERVCGRCTRQPLWADDSLGDKLPCPRACNFWLSAYQGVVRAKGSDE